MTRGDGPIRISAALGAELVAQGVPPSPADLPADSSLPVTEVVVR